MGFWGWIDTIRGGGASADGIVAWWLRTLHPRFLWLTMTGGMRVWILDGSLMVGVVLPLQLASQSGVMVAAVINGNLMSSARKGLFFFHVPARTAAAAACAVAAGRCRYCCWWSAVPAFRGTRNTAQQSGAVSAPVTMVVSGLLRPLPLGPPLQRGFPALSLALVPFPYY